MRCFLVDRYGVPHVVRTLCQHRIVRTGIRGRGCCFRNSDGERELFDQSVGRTDGYLIGVSDRPELDEEPILKVSGQLPHRTRQRGRRVAGVVGKADAEVTEEPGVERTDVGIREFQW